MLSAAETSVKEAIAVTQEFLRTGLSPVVQAAETMADALAAGNKVLTFGNGGSASDAQHFAAELINRFQLERPSLPGLALTTDTSVLTAIGNDYHFNEVFAKQVRALGAAGDVALAISTSGNSANVLAGVAAARERGMLCIGLTSQGGGELAPLCDQVVHAPSDDTPRVQEIHALCIHLFCQLIDLKLFGRDS